MGALRKGLLIGFSLAKLVPAAHIACTQTSRSLQNRIPKPDPKKYRSVQDAKDWKYPYLIVRPDGIEILGITPVGGSIPVQSVPRALERLPDSAWPYGLLAAVQDIGILS